MGAASGESAKPHFTKGLDQLLATQWGSPELDWGDVPFVSGLVNGKGRAAGKTTPLEQVLIRDGEVLRLRLINGGATYSLRFQIDNHPLTVIASDGQPLRPVTVDNLLIGIGRRSSASCSNCCRVREERRDPFCSPGFAGSVRPASARNSPAG